MILFSDEFKYSEKGDVKYISSQDFNVCSSDCFKKAGGFQLYPLIDFNNFLNNKC